MTRYVAASPEAAAQQALELAGIRPGETASAITPLKTLLRAYPLDVAELNGLTPQSADARLAAEGMGRLDADSSESEKLSGCLYANASGGFILVNRDSSNPLTRRRYTIAHEIGHYVLHFLPLLRLGPAEISEAVPGDEDERATEGRLRLNDEEADAAVQREADANAFAAAVLMPAELVRARAERLLAAYRGERHLLARRLAPEFLVSVPAVERRVAELALV
jgi:Zn-dependent peptidase ImmA (M78 family)